MVSKNFSNGETYMNIQVWRYFSNRASVVITTTKMFSSLYFLLICVSPLFGIDTDLSPAVHFFLFRSGNKEITEAGNIQRGEIRQRPVCLLLRELQRNLPDG